MLNRFTLLNKKDKQPKKEKKIKVKLYLAIKRKQRLRFYLERAGISANEKVITKILFNVSIAINIIIASYFLYLFVTKPGFSTAYILFAMLLIWLLLFPVMLFVIWESFYIIIDLKAYKRRLEIEDVLPDFLELTASNIRAGMMIDRALWYAVRPRFGILAKEIESAAKETMAGTDLRAALIRFSEKYDSAILKRAISLILEGMDAGGDIGDLISKIALDIEESKVIRKEMAANVSNYILFIGFASVVAAPVLFALSHQFLVIIQKLSAGATIPKGVSSFSTISFSGAGISSRDFNIFAILSLVITSFFSSLIIGIIKKGDTKNSVKYILFFIVTTILIFYLADKGLSSALSKFF